LFAPGKKRVLAIDGGGARGILACGILKKIETLLKNRLPQGQREYFRLHHYFDLIGGTSTGSILAAGLAIGLSVDDLKRLYLNLCPKIFVPSAQGTRVPRFKASVLAEELRRVLRESNGAALPLKLNGAAMEGDPIRLGSPALKTGFAVFSKRINTGGAWTLTNNPKWRYYNEASHKAYCDQMGLTPYASQPNDQFALAQLVQASAAAPTYFAGVGIKADVLDDGSRGVKVGKVSNIEPPDGVFVDGAMSGRNTPALQMLFMVRHPAFGFNWSTTHRRSDGEVEEDLLMISVGTGWWRPKVNNEILGLNSLFRLAPEAGRAILTLQTMMYDSQVNALQWLQAMSRYPREKEKRWTIDGEVDELMIENGAPFLVGSDPLLRFRRLDIRLEDRSLQQLFGHGVEQEAKALGLIPKADDAMRNRLIDGGKAWGESPLTMRMRELAEFDPAALQFLYTLGERYAGAAIDDHDFPAEFDPPGLEDLDGSDGVRVVEEPPSKIKRGLFSRRPT
jgi:patatin-like phospholipase/acyl hydrolase